MGSVVPPTSVLLMRRRSGLYCRYVRLRLEGSVQSDEYACRPECGSHMSKDAARNVHVVMGNESQSRSAGGAHQPRATVATLMKPLVVYVAMIVWCVGLAVYGMSPPGSPHIRPGEGEDVWPENLELGPSGERWWTGSLQGVVGFALHRRA